MDSSPFIILHSVTSLIVSDSLLTLWLSTPISSGKLQIRCKVCLGIFLLIFLIFQLNKGPSDSNALEEGRRVRLQLEELQIIVVS